MAAALLPLAKTTKGKAGAVKRYLVKKRFIPSTEIHIWDAAKITKVGHRWMEGAKCAVVCESDSDWPYGFFSAMFKAGISTEGIYVGTGWSVLIYE